MLLNYHTSYHRVIILLIITIHLDNPEDKYTEYVHSDISILPDFRPLPDDGESLHTGYVEAGVKLRESRGGKTLGEDVSKLGGGRDMENPNIADSDPVAHEVQVDLHMLRPLMLDGVGGEVHGADVVAVDERALGEWAVELRQELS